MKISLKWLSEFIQIDDYLSKPQELADVLTRAGLEVEEITDKAKELKHVVVGHIKVKGKHPNADKLSLCQVETENGRIDQIVCGAQNHKEGDKVVVALPGAVLPGNFAIKLSKIRDVESKGMLCSDKELGLSAASEGIRILPADAPIGKPFAEYFGLDDVVMELKVTPNRSDCLSHYGLARELGCLLGRAVKPIAPKVNINAGLGKKDPVHVQVDNSDLCIRYSGRSIRGVKVGPSPDWFRKKLELVGLNSINNVVDVTNYVMFELGQPLHAFDSDRLAGSKIVVRTAKAQESMKTLKEQELNLKGEELLICDGDRAVALAGVIGGLNSGVQDQTKNLFIESANFNSMAVRRASRGHGIETDSAYRFSRGVDPEQTVLIMNRACELIQQVAGGECLETHFDFYPRPVVKQPIEISIQTVSDRLGFDCEEKLFAQLLKGLHCQVNELGNGKYKVVPPSFRFDLEQDMDLVEEYARLKGYEHIAETIPPLATGPVAHDLNYLRDRKLAQLMVSLGFSEAFNYAFLNREKEMGWVGDAVQLTGLGLRTSPDVIGIMNPLSEELNVMRRTLSHQMFSNVVTNFHAGNEAGALFSIGPVFSKQSTDGKTNYVEERRLCVCLWGEEFGIFSEKVPLIYKLKAALTRISQSLKISKISFQQIASVPVFLHTGQNAKIVVEGKAVGFLGSIHPTWLANEKIRVPVVMMEISLSQLIPERDRPLKFKPVSTTQPVYRDFAFLMDVRREVGDLVKEIEKSSGPNLISIQVFDVYKGEKVESGKQSVAIRVYLSGGDTTLTDAEMQAISSKILQSAEKGAGAILRS